MLFLIVGASIIYQFICVTCYTTAKQIKKTENLNFIQHYYRNNWKNENFKNYYTAIASNNEQRLENLINQNTTNYHKFVTISEASKHIIYDNAQQIIAFNDIFVSKEQAIFRSNKYKDWTGDYRNWDLKYQKSNDDLYAEFSINGDFRKQIINRN